MQAQFTWTLDHNIKPGSYSISVTGWEVVNGEVVSGKQPVTVAANLIVTSASSAVWQTP
jgi:hypothetical protein